MYGIQTDFVPEIQAGVFENDVKMYGIQTLDPLYRYNVTFENDVKMYGIQTGRLSCADHYSLRMM